MKSMQWYREDFLCIFQKIFSDSSNIFFSFRETRRTFPRVSLWISLGILAAICSKFLSKNQQGYVAFLRDSCQRIRWRFYQRFIQKFNRKHFHWVIACFWRDCFVNFSSNYIHGEFLQVFVGRYHKNSLGNYFW